MEDNGDTWTQSSYRETNGSRKNYSSLTGTIMVMHDTVEQNQTEMHTSY